MAAIITSKVYSLIVFKGPRGTKELMFKGLAYFSYLTQKIMSKVINIHGFST